ncbi:MAG TPA: hypothetical protein PKA84_00740 [Rubrivivax sp.]|nr:hypothetical protein [Rhodoferax sp.]MCL4737069.1 hypothetical protein [Burkholderiaceae bacterium]MCP5289177.1 hypothetical protein [Burkholderiaceae bacterium]HMQ74005.1 hypothetical protein [Rubrivivax sp.]HMR68736.1 hypothetical protein [Rubrivivax sp.]
MTSDRPSRPSPALDALEFELTDLDEARRALDELPPGVGTAQAGSPGYWKGRRRPPQPTDRALTGAAIEWMLGLREDLRPRELCERFPRLANALATAWADAAQRQQALEKLVNDERGQRSGFPHAVRMELELLYGVVLAGHDGRAC